MINKCPKDDSYTLQSTCSCGATTISVKPPKYSPQDKYASYRRAYKKQQEE